MQEGDLDLDEEEAKLGDVCDSLTLEQGREDDLTQVEYEFPLHEKCDAHSLNLVTSSDVDKCLSSSTLSRNIYRGSFAKCPSLWNKANRSTLASAADYVERKLIVLTATCWNCYFDAVLQIVENRIKLVMYNIGTSLFQ